MAWLLPLACCLLPACQQKMASQPSYRPDQTSPFFNDGRAARPTVPSTVARGHLRTDLHYFAGLKPGAGGQRRFREELVARWDPLGALTFAYGEQADYVDTFPFPITTEVIRHGRDRFMIFCVVCHDPLGTGRGKIVERGYTPPPDFHIERLRNVPVGHIFDVITNGYGSMPEYKQQVPPRDRWAIAAYIRALQLSQHFPREKLTDEMQAEWKKQEAGGQP
jgi:mono/diheme cytochrome c family protein